MSTNTQSRIGLAVITVLMVCACWAQADIPAFVDYHATWAKDPGTGDGYWDVNDPSYGYPEWQVTGQPPFTYPTGRLNVPNEADPNKVKEVWLEIEWWDQSTFPETLPVITLTDPSSGVTNLVGAPSVEGYGYTWRWHIKPQPNMESFQMPPNLPNDPAIKTIEVGTFCATTTVHKPQNLYGTLSQLDGNDNACGPTATANSFAYLERAYPDTYDRRLVPDLPGPPEDDYGFDELAAVANALGNLMGWTAKDGVTTEGLVNGKVEYITARAPGTTAFGAQMKGTWDTDKGDKPWFVTQGTAPTWTWLNEQLVSCEDVEFIIRPVGGGFGHVMTLTGMTWQDTNSNGVIDPGEATINYIDPVGATRDELPVTLVGGELRMTYKGNSVYIDAAVKESIPEPAMMTLLALGGLAVLRRRRRSR